MLKAIDRAFESRLLRDAHRALDIFDAANHVAHGDFRLFLMLVSLDGIVARQFGERGYVGDRVLRLFAFNRGGCSAKCSINGRTALAYGH